MLENQFNFSHNAVTVTQVVANLGAMTGGTVIGYCKRDFCTSHKPTGADFSPSVSNLWSPIFDHRHVHCRWYSPLPLWLHFQQTDHCGCLF